MKTQQLTAPTTFENVESVRKANKSIGHKWFDTGSMNFFNSQVNGADKLINKRFFISSEQFIPSRGPAEPRMFIIRIVSPNGEIDTYGEFQAYSTKGEAIAAARKIS